MSSIRVRFVRGEEVKYISHLDLMKAFERALRRANLPISYSQGFNPHPMMVFGLPLSVGVTSEAEYADFELSADTGTDEFVRRLNSQFPEGLKVVAAGVKLGKSNIMASVCMASYIVLVRAPQDLNTAVVQKHIDELMVKTEVMVRKETKSGLKDVDIRPMIHELRVEELEPWRNKPAEDHACGKQPDRKQPDRKQSAVETGASATGCSNACILDYARNLADSPALGSGYKDTRLLCLSMLLSAGSAANLKPELLVQALNAVGGADIKLIKTHRTGLFVEAGGKTLDPLDSAALQI